MKITIKKGVFKKYSKLKIAFIFVEGIDNSMKLKESRHLLEETEQLIGFTFNKDTAKTHLLISPWKTAQEEFGKEAKHYQTSVERLIKKVVKGKSTTTGNVVGNLSRYLALKHIVPFGVDNFDKIKGDLTFDLATGREKVGVLRNLKKGALYYKDEKSILGTKLDYWKSKKTELDKKSKSALIHFEILPPLNGKKLGELLKETKDLVKTFCDGKVSSFVLDENNNVKKI
jgi:DNA/RNA-binding domain of Phe-tRNA-synthetase-like protein